MIELEKEFGTTYIYQNVLISGTHTHSGPGGYQEYVTYEVTTQGFVEEAFNSFVIGIVEVRLILSLRISLQ